jgi:hypothetical protein
LFFVWTSISWYIDLRCTSQPCHVSTSKRKADNDGENDARSSRANKKKKHAKRVAPRNGTAVIDLVDGYDEEISNRSSSSQPRQALVWL